MHYRLDGADNASGTNGCSREPTFQLEPHSLTESISKWMFPESWHNEIGCAEGGKLKRSAYSQGPSHQRILPGVRGNSWYSRLLRVLTMFLGFLKFPL